MENISDLEIISIYSEISQSTFDMCIFYFASEYQIRSWIILDSLIRYYLFFHENNFQKVIDSIFISSHHHIDLLRDHPESEPVQILQKSQ